MKLAAEARGLRRQTRGCVASMPLWHVSGEGREEMQQSGCVCVLERGVGGAFYGCDLADKRLNLSGIGYPLGASVSQ